MNFKPLLTIIFVVAIYIVALSLSQGYLIFAEITGIDEALIPYTLPVLGLDPLELSVFHLFLLGLTILVLSSHADVFREQGISKKTILKNIKIGVMAGVLLLVIGQGLEHLVSSFIGESPIQKTIEESAKHLEALPVLILWGGIMAPISEEVYFRGLAYPVFRKAMGIRLGIVTSGIYFAVGHVDPYALIPLAVVGIGLSYLYQRTGSIVPCITTHIFFNTVSLIMAYFGIL